MFFCLQKMPTLRKKCRGKPFFLPEFGKDVIGVIRWDNTEDMPAEYPW
jgi:hypothetical protein